MSYGLITGGGPDGRYTIELDYGEAAKASILANLGIAQTNLTVKLGQQQTIVDECDASEQAALANLILFQEALTAEMAANNGEVDDSAMKLYTDLLERYRRLQVQHTPARRALATIKGQLAECNREIVRYNNAVTSETKNAWCCDLTEDASGYVSTVDIPGETNLMLIAPGGRAWTAEDGIFTARDIQSPAQAYFNAAILPGWQKFMPTYRWGTVRSINATANTMTVDLADAISSAQSLDVNQTTTLEDVPVTYMTCNCLAFKDGDRCVVQFNGMSWDSPTVIGFLDTPKRCGNITFDRLRIFANWSVLGARYDCVYYGSLIDATLLSEILASPTSYNCEIRRNSGAWTTVANSGFGAGWSIPDGAGATDFELLTFGLGSGGETAIQIVDFSGFISNNTKVELRLVRDSSIKVNFVVQYIAPFAGTTVISSTGTPGVDGSIEYGGLTGFAYTRTQLSVLPTSENAISALTGYTLSMES